MNGVNVPKFLCQCIRSLKHIQEFSLRTERALVCQTDAKCVFMCCSLLWCSSSIHFKILLLACLRKIHVVLYGLWIEEILVLMLVHN